MGQKYVNGLIKKAEFRSDGTLGFGDNILGTTGKPTRQGNNIIIPFNYDFNNNRTEFANNKENLNLLQKTLGRVVHTGLGPYSMDASPALFGGIPLVGGAVDLALGAVFSKAIQTSKTFGGGKHVPGELKINIKQLEKDNPALFDRLFVEGLITVDDLGLKKARKVTQESYQLTESTRRQLREIKKPYEIREEPVQKLKKYRPNFKGKFKAQNTPDVTASKQSDELVASGNAKGQTWRTKDKNWSRYETQERMNVVFDKVGHGNMAWDMIVNENQRKNSWKNRQIQEQLNMIAAEKGERQLYPDYESPWGKVIHEQQTIDTDKDPAVKVKHPLVKGLAKRLKGQIDYPEKPAKKGYPNDPPPKMVDGWHPKLGQKYKYDKLDPVSARAMPLQGNPEIDANIKKARQEPKIEPGKEPKKVPIPAPKVKKEQYSDWRSEEKIRKGLTNA